MVEAEEIKRIVESMRSLGTPDEEIRITLKEMGVPDTLISQILPPEVPEAPKVEEVPVEEVKEEEKKEIREEPEEGEVLPREETPAEPVVPVQAAEVQGSQEILAGISELKGEMEAVKALLREILETNRKILQKLT